MNNSSDSDGVDVSIKHWDGTVETVRVRRIPRDELGRFDDCLCACNTAGESLECAFYVGKDKAWAATLDDESFERVLTEGQRLNLERFAAWVKRQRARVEASKSGMNGNN